MSQDLPPRPPLFLALNRQTQVFAQRADLAERLADLRVVVEMAPDELLHPDQPAEFVVRRGKLRVSQLLRDGREVTRSVLQAGGVMTIRETSEDDSGHEARNGDNPADDIYSLPDLIMMALGETELWRLPPGSLDSV